LDPIQIQVYVKIGSVKVFLVEQLDSEQLLQSRPTKPGKMRKIQKVFSLAHQWRGYGRVKMQTEAASPRPLQADR
jgi:hypothetical protein